MNTQAKTLLPATLVALAVLGLSACGDRRTDDERTAGQKLDSAIATAKDRTDQATTTASAEMDKARAAGNRAADAAGNQVRDAAITASINAELVKDPALSALQINVDTQNGRVALRGNAPDAAAVDRATTLARKVDGVTSVDNQLVIRQ